jgi:hypothetical protein
MADNSPFDDGDWNDLPDFSAALATLRRHIDVHGWSLTATEGFAYTTGLTGGDHPEILIAGLDPYTAHDVATAAVRRIRDGVPLKPGCHYPGIVSSFLVEVRELDLEDRGRFPRNITTAHYGRKVPAVQLVYPDKDGRFPGEPGCSLHVTGVQDSGVRRG